MRFIIMSWALRNYSGNPGGKSQHSNGTQNAPSEQNSLPVKDLLENFWFITTYVIIICSSPHVNHLNGSSASWSSSCEASYHYRGKADIFGSSFTTL